MGSHGPSFSPPPPRVSHGSIASLAAAGLDAFPATDRPALLPALAAEDFDCAAAAFRRGDFALAADQFGDVLERCGGAAQADLGGAVGGGGVRARAAAAALSNRSAARVALGTLANFRLAVADARALLALRPGWPQGWLRLGIALRSLSKFAQAEEALARGLAAAEGELRRCSVGPDGNDSNDGGGDARSLEAARAAGYVGTVGPAATGSGGVEQPRWQPPQLPGAADSIEAAEVVVAQFCVARAELQRMAGFEGGGDHPDDELFDEEAGDSDRFKQLETWLLSSSAAASSSSSPPSSLSASYPLSAAAASTFRGGRLYGGEASFSAGAGAGSGGPSATSSFPFLHMRRYSENNRGVHMRCDVPAETEVLAVGLDFLITVEMGRACPLGRRLAAAGIERELSASKHCYLALFLLWDRKTNPQSFFQPYYAILPAAYPNMPVFWDAPQLAWLEGSFLLRQVEDRRANLRADYELQTRAVGPDFAAVASLDDFCWARMVVSSRNFGIVVDGVRTDALVPYADMLNHSRPRQTRWQFDSKRRAFLIISMQPLHCGAQVFDSYGKKCNSRFLLNYGFAVERNCDDDVGQNHNEVRLLVGMLPPQGDPWHTRKQELLGGLALLLPPHDEHLVPAPLPPFSPLGSGAATADDGEGSEGGGPSASSSPGRTGGKQGRAGDGKLSLPPSPPSPQAPAGAPHAPSSATASLAGDLELGGGGGAGSRRGGAGAATAARDLVQAQTPARAVRISTFYDYDGTAEAFSFLRFVHARAHELLQLPRMDEDFDLARRPVGPLSCANEAAALRHLAALCGRQLHQYPSLLAEDAAALASGRLPYGSNRRNALVLVMGEKEVCAHYVGLAAHCCPLLEAAAAVAPGPGQLAQLLVAAIALRARLAAAGSEQPSGSEANAARYVAAVVLPLLQKREAAERAECAAALAAGYVGEGDAGEDRDRKGEW